jgi:hypothetical protein
VTGAPTELADQRSEQLGVRMNIGLMAERLRTLFGVARTGSESVGDGASRLLLP